jgi:CRISPR system Cascade subunit CasB
MTTTPTAPVPVRDLVARLAHQHISGWQRGYVNDEAKAVAAVARLRRGAGRLAGQVPDLWDLVDVEPLHTVRGDRPQLSEGEVDRASEALHVACTLWAQHQQGRGVGMHELHRPERPRGLGSAVRRLMAPGEIDEPVRTRLVRAGNAAGLPNLAFRLRDIVTLLRREDIRLDYAVLAGQLYQWQWPGGPDRVRTAWGRSFHARQATGEQRDTPAAARLEPGAVTTRSTDHTDKDAS